MVQSFLQTILVKFSSNGDILVPRLWSPETDDVFMSQSSKQIRSPELLGDKDDEPLAVPLSLFLAWDPLRVFTNFSG